MLMTLIIALYRNIYFMTSICIGLCFLLLLCVVLFVVYCFYKVTLYRYILQSLALYIASCTDKHTAVVQRATDKAATACSNAFECLQLPSEYIRGVSGRVCSCLILLNAEHIFSTSNFFYVGNISGQ